MKESEWTRRVGDALTKAGAIVVPNVMGMRSANIPDRTVISKYGVHYVEFKGRTTKLRTGQRLWIKQANTRYRCAFVYRYPDLLYFGAEEVLVSKVDAIAEPKRFLQFLRYEGSDPLKPQGLTH
jgi:hypothetical protein